jgi:hypothetical protein
MLHQLYFLRFFHHPYNFEHEHWIPIYQSFCKKLKQGLREAFEDA